MTRQQRCAEKLAQVLRDFLSQAGYGAENVGVNDDGRGNPTVWAEVGGFSFMPIGDKVYIEWGELKWEPLDFPTPAGCFIENQNSFTAIIYKA